ncbi:MAG: hypothetical protein AAGA55_03590 [Planctomycetota bacterium]
MKLRMFSAGCAGMLAQPILLAGNVTAQEPPRVLFVRGAERSGGFFEGQNDFALTEQLADIGNQSTSGGNHGWFELAELLRGAGFIVEQAIEPLEPGAPSTGQTNGAPLPFDQVPLRRYRVIVLGSNNAVYQSEQIDAVEDYVWAGGGLLLISDANFGSDWPDAANSDQQFLDRFGWTMQQDQGTYQLRRQDGDFLIPSHPVLDGVDVFDGEGVSPIVLPVSDMPGVRSLLVARAKPGRNTRNNDSDTGQGTSRPVGPRDAALCVAYAGAGRLAGHIDRNTFFNANGAGTSINRFDNAAYAVNLITWLAFGEHDRDADLDVDIDDLHEQNQQAVDVNGDGRIDAQDIDATMRLVRFSERRGTESSSIP